MGRTKKGLRFYKGHIFGNIELSRGRMITLVALLGWRITNENTLKSSWIKFISVNLGDVNKAHTAKHSKGKRGMQP